MANASMMKLNTDQSGRLRLHEQLDLVCLSPRTRRNVTKRMAREVRKNSRLNIRTQKTVHGSPMEKRRAGRTRRKMLRGLGQSMKIYSRGPNRAEVTWAKPMTAKIADRHQNGIPESWTAGKARKIYGVPDYNKPATRAQAKSLNAAGYRLRVRKKKGKGCSLKRVSIKWIMGNLSLGQAGIILRLMRDGTRRGKQSWTTKPPARPFLGPKPGSEGKFLDDLAMQALSDIRNR